MIFRMCAAAASAIVLIFFVSIQLYTDHGIRIPSASSGAVPQIFKSASANTDQPSTDQSLNPDANPDQLWQEQEVELGDGVYRYDRRLTASAPDLLVLVLTKDEQSWGYNFGHPARTFEDFLEMLNETNLDAQSTSLGLLTNDQKEFDLFKKRTAELGFARTSIFLHPGYSTEVDRLDRHATEVQLQRRREIARLRNYLMFSTLENEPHLLWLDSDVYYIMPGLIDRMLAHAEKPEVGVLTARCEIGPISDYDANSFAFGTNEMPGLLAAERAINENPTMRNVTIRVGQLIEDTEDHEIIPLDSVGATTLYIRSSLVREGLGFTYQSVIGTTWENEGWDGLESEGMCYRLRPLGSKCFVLGGKWYTRHTDR